MSAWNSKNWSTRLPSGLGTARSLKSAEDSSNNDHLSRQAELTNLLTKVGEVASFINPEIQQISDETLQRFLDDPQDL
jgi:hypothetical protein